MTNENKYTVKSPILFLTFNRPGPTKKVFESIKSVKPSKLYISSDGPREDVDGEIKVVNELRYFLQKNISWNCEVHELFNNKNQGCGLAVSNAISWFFMNEEEGIILEDDCLPSPSFYQFCDDLLKKYRNDFRVWNIGGYKPNNIHVKNNSYEFSEFSHIWGWASWANRWNFYDYRMKNLHHFSNKDHLIFSIKKMNKKRLKELKNPIAWDSQWNFCIRSNNGLSIRPSANMIQNIGFGDDATNTNFVDLNISKNKATNLKFPINHPKFISVSHKNDIIYSNSINHGFFKRCINFIKRIINARQT